MRWRRLGGGQSAWGASIGCLGGAEAIAAQLGLQGGRGQAQLRRGAVGPVDLAATLGQAVAEDGRDLGVEVRAGWGRGSWRGSGGDDAAEGGAEVEGVADAEDEGALEEVLQLADVAGPVMRLELSLGRGIDMGWAAVHPASVLVEEMAGQGGEVAAALPQGGQGDGEDVETVIEIGPELTGGDHGFEVAVGGGDDADIHLEGLLAAHPLDVPLLQGAQELDLEWQGGVADLVEEEGSEVCLFEAAEAALYGASESTLLVTKELRFDQGLRDGAEVDGDEGLVGARAELMDEAGHALLPGARFAAQQDAGVGGGDEARLAQGVLHGWAEGGVEPLGPGGLDLFFEAAVLAAQALVEASDLFDHQAVVQGDGHEQGEALRGVEAAAEEALVGSVGDGEGAEEARADLEGEDGEGGVAEVAQGLFAVEALVLDGVEGEGAALLQDLADQGARQREVTAGGLLFVVVRIREPEEGGDVGVFGVPLVDGDAGLAKVLAQEVGALAQDLFEVE